MATATDPCRHGHHPTVCPSCSSTSPTIHVPLIPVTADGERAAARAWASRIVRRSPKKVMVRRDFFCECEGSHPTRWTAGSYHQCMECRKPLLPLAPVRPAQVLRNDNPPKG